MARPPRIEIANGIYHVVARGNERAPIFWDDSDRVGFLELLSQVRDNHRWRVFAYCLMGNHYHLLAQTPEPNLARGMLQLNGVYAQRFNRRHGRVGHLLQGRYGARLVQEDGHLLAAVRYIVRNPVHAGLCSSPGGWRFSSHRAMLGEEPSGLLDTAYILSYYGRTRDVARAHYREHTSLATDSEHQAHELVEGDDAFIARTLETLERAPGLPRRYFRGPRPELAALLQFGGDDSLALAHDEHGYSLRVIAGQLGCHASTVSRRLRRHRARSRSATNET